VQCLSCHTAHVCFNSEYMRYGLEKSAQNEIKPKENQNELGYGCRVGPRVVLASAKTRIVTERLYWLGVLMEGLMADCSHTTVLPADALVNS